METSRVKAAMPTGLWSRFRVKDKWLGIVFLAPTLIFLLFLLSYPLVSSIWLGFHSKHLIRPGTHWNGLGNYVEIFQEEQFWRSVEFGVIFTFVSVGLQLVVGLGLALLLNEDLKGQGVARGLFILPFAVPVIVSAYLWRWMLNNVYGILNWIVMWLGLIDKPLLWLGNVELARVAVILVNVWRGYPFVMIVLLAALQGIPEGLYEAAKVDGASAWQRFRYVTLPGIKMAVAIVIILRTMWIFNFFDLIWLLTGGGPARSTSILPIEIYLRSFLDYRMGEAASMAVIEFLILAVLVAILFKFLLRREEE
jgi:multiple sugar transport system permease protein